MKKTVGIYTKEDRESELAWLGCKSYWVQILLAVLSTLISEKLYSSIHCLLWKYTKN